MQPNDSPDQIEAQMRVLASVIDDLSHTEAEWSPPPAPPLTEADPGLPAIDTSVEPEASLVLDAPPLDPAAEPTPVEAPARQPAPTLRLTTDVARLADFMAVPILATGSCDEICTWARAIFHDTPRHSLRRAGLALSIRQDDTGFVQALGPEPFDDPDPLRHGAHETPLSSLATDPFAVLPHLPSKLRDHLVVFGLTPVFTSETHRRLRTVELPSGMVEVVFDRTIVTAGEKSETIAEIGLTLREGRTEALHDVAMRLGEYGALRPTVRGHALRGFDVALGRGAEVAKPAAPDLDPDAPLDDAVAAILALGLGQLLGAIPAAEDGRDPAGIHQVRVALRRLRPAFSLLRNVARSSVLDGLQRDARWLAGSLGGARSWDIFLGDTLPIVSHACAGLEGFTNVERRAASERQSAYSLARSALADRRTCRFAITLGAWIERRGWRTDASVEGLRALSEPASQFADRRLSAQHRKFVKRGRHFKHLSPEGRHQLRLAAKKLRYSTEFLLPLLPAHKVARRYTRRLRALQNLLGRYNDMTATARLLDWGDADLAPQVARAVGAVAGWQAHGIVTIEPSLRAAWRDFGRSKAPWSAPRNTSRRTAEPAAARGAECDEAGAAMVTVATSPPLAGDG